MSEQTLQLVARLRARLHDAIRRITLADLAFGLLVVLGTLAGLWLLAAAVEAGLWLEPTPRSVLVGSAGALLLGLLVFFVGRPLLRLAGVLPSPPEEEVAGRIGARFPEVADRLVNLLQLSGGKGSPAAAPLVDAAVRRLGEPLVEVPFEQVEDFGRARRLGRLASLPLVGLVAFMAVAPGAFFGASQRLLTPTTHYQRPAPFHLEVAPGDVSVLRGEALGIVVEAPGTQAPDEVTLLVNHEGEDYVEAIALRADSTGAYRYTLPNVRGTFRYRASAEPVVTQWYTATVQERPLVQALQVTLTPPAYTGLPPQRLALGAGDVAALPGTTVDVTVTAAGADLAAAFLRFSDSLLVPLSLEGSQARGRFAVRREGHYEVLLRSATGLENADPIRYRLQLLSDAFPTITLQAPLGSLDLDETLATPIRARIADDFGFSSLKLYYRLAESRLGSPQETYRPVDLPLDRRQLDQAVGLDWDVARAAGLDPVPGDVIEFFLEVRDNDAVAGFKPARTSPLRLRVPSLAEHYEALEQQQNATEEAVEEILDESDAIRDQFEELRDELRQKQDADWEDRRQLDRLQQRQQQLEERVESVAEQLDDVIEQMQNNNLVDPQTMEMYRELQRVVEEANSPELREALQKLQEAMENLNLQQMQESIQNFEFNEQQYRERLERTLELFKKVRLQQELDEAAKRAQELARQQQELARETQRLQQQEQRPQDRPADNKQGENKQGENKQGENKQGENKQGENKQNQRPPSPQDAAAQRERLAQEQERNQEEMKALEEQIREAREQMEELRNAPRQQQQMQQLQQQMERQRLPEQMKENARQLRQNQMSPAQQQQQQMQQQLQQLSQQLSQMKDNMMGQQKEVNAAGLRRALSDVLTLSQQQETLRRTVDAAASANPQLRAEAQRQQELADGLRVVSDSLQKLARNIPEMTREVQQQAGDALKAMGTATETLSERAAAQATAHQKTSMMHLNELALMLSELLNNMQNSSSGSGGGMSMQQMMEQLQRMSGQQEQLNEQIQQMLNDIQGNRLSMDQQQRLEQMARQQEALQRQLEQMSRDPNARRALGNLRRIAEEMEETIDELRRGQPTRRTVERQQQILTRLLDAQKSLRERGEDKKRQGRTADDPAERESPPALTPQEKAQQLRRDLIRALESGYAPDYQNLIKRYFELLQQRDQ